ncbi:MAG: hypothetical protein CHACPFDD_00360 [Phycisphaerae bacterium]|nr:hypothetical protein [Phycisphaerae bacterium]
MTPRDESFEQLLSTWLDARGDAALHRAVHDAATDARRVAELARWQRIDDALRAITALPSGVDWARLQRSIRARIEQDLNGAMVDDDRLTRLLRRETAASQDVDWPGMRERLARAAHGPAQPRIVRYRRWTAGLALVAAAAIIIVALLSRLGSPRPADTASGGAASARPAFVSASLTRRTPSRPTTDCVVLASYTRMEIAATADDTPAGDDPSGEDDLFVMIDALDPTANREGLTGT